MKKNGWMVAGFVFLLAGFLILLFVKSRQDELVSSRSSVVSLPIVSSSPPSPVRVVEVASETLRPARGFSGRVEVDDRFVAADVLEVRETDPDSNGRFERVRLVKTEFKYPFLRVEEDILLDSKTGREILEKQKAMVADHVMVKVQSGVGEKELSEAVKPYGGSIRKKMYAPDLWLIEFESMLDAVPEAMAALAQADDSLVFSEPDYIVHACTTIPTDSRFDELWGMHNSGNHGRADADIDAPEAWAISTGASNIVVGIIDSGIDYNHEDLAANMWMNPGEAGPLSTNGVDDDGNGFVDDVHGWDFSDNDNDPMDSRAHGTHCAGTIGAVGDNGVGVVGVCWNVRLMALKFMSESVGGTDSDAIDAIYYGVRMKARILSNSWGGDGSAQNLYDAIEMANRSNVLFVAAAGNTARNNDDYPHYPSSYTNENVLSVAASDWNDELAAFSCYGSVSVDLAAPGSFILSCFPNDGYQALNGTSMATPHVAGAAALLLACDDELDVASLKNLLMTHVDTHAAFSGKMVTHGRLNIHNAIVRVDGLHFDKQEYAVDRYATVTLLNRELSNTTSHVVYLSSAIGDTETLTLYETEPGGSIFTNRIYISRGSIPTNDNQRLEGVHGTELDVSYTHETFGVTNRDVAVVDLGLKIIIQTPPTLIPLQTPSFSVEGVSIGGVPVHMVVSNETTGDAVAFIANHDWVAPAVSVTQDENIIWVSGGNEDGFSDVDSVTITRVGPTGTNYVSRWGSHTWPYTSWATAATNIQDAVNASCPGNLLLLTNETYALTNQVSVDRGVILQGLNGKENTIIQGNGSNRCFYLSHPDAVLDGCTITGGGARSDIPSGDRKGGGVYSLEGGVVRNCLIADNSAGWGGGMYGESDPLITNCIVRNNSATHYGGGLRLVGGAVKDSFLEGNSSSFGGGASLIYDGEVSGCTLSGNHASDHGGGVYFSSGGMIKNSVVKNNISDLRGGGVYVKGTGQITDCTIEDNTALNEGGGVYNGSIDRCVILGNKALNEGGGMIYVLEAHNCVVMGNTAARGGGAYASSLENCTVVRNQASIEGGGAYDSTLLNSIIYYNTAGTAGNNAHNGDISYSCITPDVEGEGNITNAPVFIASNDVHLVDGSACVDAGSNQPWHAEETDLDGALRLQNEVVDMGVYEGAVASAWVATSLLEISVRVPVSENPPNQMFDLWNAGPETLAYQMTTDVAWLSVDPATGSSSGERDTVTLSFDTDSLSVGTYQGSLSILSDEAGNAPRVLPVELSVLDAHFVDISNAAPVAPYTSWATAATQIQDAIDVAEDGDIVLVRDGFYDSGGAVVYDSLSSRVAITNQITVQSVNGAARTFIVGAEATGGGNGEGAVRGVYVGSNSFLIGFTVTNGHTREEFGWEDGWEMEVNGGGVCCEDGSVVSNCILVGNSARYLGAGVYQGAVYNTLIKGNAGGGASEATLRNCLVTLNTSRSGTDCCDTWNCTIVGNTGLGVDGGIHKNSIIYYNIATDGSVANFSPDSGSLYFDYCVTFPAPEYGEGNLTNAPGFLALGNPHIVSNSPCMDAGNNADVIIGEQDIDGDMRRVGAAVDIGCDEYYGPDISGTLRVDILVNSLQTVVGFPLPFQSDIEDRAYRYEWNWGDGTSTSNQLMVSHAFRSVGDYDVVLTAWNQQGVSSATVTVTIVDSKILYVSPEGGHVVPYTNWATASTNIQDAINASPFPGCLVLVTNGVYEYGGSVLYGSMSNRVAITNNVTVQSVNGPEATVIQGEPSTRCAYIKAGGILSGFTLANGVTRTTGSFVHEQSGGGVFCFGASALVTNCIIRGNTARFYGGGAYGGTLRDCDVGNNTVDDNGGGAYRTMAYNCAIYNNEAAKGGGAFESTLYDCVIGGNTGSYGAGVHKGAAIRCLITNNIAEYEGGGTYQSEVRNCLIVENSAPSGGGAADSTVNHCTLVSNTAGAGGGTHWSIVKNSILVANTATIDNDIYVGGGSVEYSCYLGATNGVDGNINNDPHFIDSAADDYRLQTSSVCIESGLNSEVKDVADLAGNPRLYGTYVDMGAYEHQGGTDADGDGLPNAWERDQSGGVTNLNPNAMASNGVNTLRGAYIAGLNPTNPASFFTVDSIGPLRWCAVSGRVYTIYWTSNLISGFGAPWKTNITEGVYTDTTHAAQGKGFYKIEVELE